MWLSLGLRHVQQLLTTGAHSPPRPRLLSQQKRGITETKSQCSLQGSIWGKEGGGGWYLFLLEAYDYINKMSSVEHSGWYKGFYKFKILLNSILAQKAKQNKTNRAVLLKNFHHGSPCWREKCNSTVSEAQNNFAYKLEISSKVFVSSLKVTRILHSLPCDWETCKLEAANLVFFSIWN